MKPTKLESTVAIHKNSYFFGLYRFHSEGQNVNKLRQLRSENITTEIDFFVGEIAWTEKVVSEIIKTFHYYEGRRWNEGRFHTSLGLIETLRFHRVLQAAVQSRLFRKLRFGGSRAGSSNLGTAYATTLAYVFRNAVALDRVTLFDFDISSEAASILALGLIHDDDEDDANDHQEGWRGPRELVLEGNRFLWEPPSNEYMTCQNAAVHLAMGLSRNKKLELLSLRNTYLDDTTLSILLQSIRGHATLKTLQVTFCDFGPFSMHSLQDVLSDRDCHLQELELSNHVAISRMSHRSFDMSTFLSTPIVNTSLTSLHLTKQGLTDRDVHLLLQNLCRFQNLTHLDLQLNQIWDLSKVVVLETTPDAPHSNHHHIHGQLRHLDLDYNDCFVELTTPTTTSHTEAVVQDGGPTNTPTPATTFLAMVELLHRFPRLACLGQEFRQLLDGSGGNDYTRYLQHCLDMHQCGGFLLTSSRDQIPISLWPLILAKSRELDLPSRQANVLYHMLREGPAFCGRDSC